MKEKAFYNVYSHNQLMSETFVNGSFSKNTVEIKDIDEFIDKVVTKGGNDNSNIIGSIILQKRLNRDLTQSDVSDGICSISYISNLEANKYVKFNSSFIYGICEKLEINYHDLVSISPVNLIKQVYKYYLHSQITEIEKICDQLQTTIFVPGEDLLRAFNCIIHNDADNFSLLMKQVDDVKKSLSTDEVIFMLYVMINYFIRAKIYKKAYQYLELINRFDILDKNLRVLIQEANYYTMGNLVKDGEKYEYLKLKAFYDDYYPLSKQLSIKLQNMLFHPEESMERIDNMSIEEIDKNNKVLFIYTKAYCLLVNNRYTDCLDLLLEYKYKTSDFVALFGYAVFLLIQTRGDKKIINEYKKIYHEMCKDISGSIDERIHLAFIELINYEIDKTDIGFICDYIKNIFLHTYEDYQYMPYKKYIDARYPVLLHKLSRYKDSSMYALECENFLKNIEFYCIISNINNKTK